LRDAASWVVHSYNTLCKYECVPLADKVLHVVAKTVGFITPIALAASRKS